MTLLVTIFAAIITTVIWYSNEKARQLKVGILCYMFWGASLMWFVDAIFEYVSLRADYFIPTATDMLNDLFLGFQNRRRILSAVPLLLKIWQPAPADFNPSACQQFCSSVTYGISSIILLIFSRLILGSICFKALLQSSFFKEKIKS